MKRIFIALLLAPTLASAGFSQVIFNEAIGKRSNAAGCFDKNGSLHVVIQGDSLGRSGSNEKQWRYLCISNDSVKIDESFDAPSEATITAVLATTPGAIHVLADDTNGAEGFSPLHLLRTGGKWGNVDRVPLETKKISPLQSAAAIVSDGTVYCFYLDLQESGRNIIHCSEWQPLKGWSKLHPVNVGEEVQSLSCAGDFQSQRPMLGWITKSDRCFFISAFDPAESEQKIQSIPIAAHTALALYKTDAGGYALTRSDLLKANWDRQQSTLRLHQVDSANQVQNGFALTNHFPSSLDHPYLGHDDGGLTLVWSSSADGQPGYEAPRDMFYSTQRAGKWAEPRQLNFKSADHLGIKILDGFSQNGRLRIGALLVPSGLMSSVSHGSRIEVVEIDDKDKR